MCILPEFPETGWADCPVQVRTAEGTLCRLSMKAGPVWNARGTLVALEFLSEIFALRTGERIPAEYFFAQATPVQQTEILGWQLGIIVQLRPWCQTRNVRISLNINRTLASAVLVVTDIMHQIATLRDILRLELSEHFIHPGYRDSADPLVQALSELTPLWLDDFGCGTTPYLCLTDGQFEAIKLDRCFTRRLYRMRGGGTFLRGLVALTAGTGTLIITEGVEDRHMWDFVKTSGVTVSQGWLWPELQITELYSLSETLEE